MISAERHIDCGIWLKLLIFKKSKPIHILKRITIFLLTILVCKAGTAQTKMITGIVMDSVAHVPLQNVSVCIKNSSRCVLTDNDGKFRITVERGTQKLAFTATGYFASTLLLTDSARQKATVLLSKSYTTMADVVVNGKRKRYRNKNNPAVDLIRLVIANKSKNGPAAYPYTSYQQYEKVRMFIDRPPQIVTHSWPIKKFHFFFENIDTTTVPKKSLSSIYLHEVLSENYYRRQPEKKKQVILGQKSVDYGEYVDMRGIKAALSRIYEDINIYDNAISAFTTQFVSPVAELAPTFYMYFIRDTIEEDGVKLVKLYFEPRNPEDLLFQGLLYITLDGNYAIRRVEMGITKHTNLNWVRNLAVNQDFEKGPGGRYHLAVSDLSAFFTPFAKSRGIFADRKIIISHLSDTTLSDAVLSGAQQDSLPDASHKPALFWSEGRPVPLSESEARTYANTDSLLKMHSYRRLMDLATAFTIGYKSAGKFDVGPIGNFYSFNPVEGQKFRFGGRTNTKMSNRIFLDSYVAYGFKDERWKYFLSGAYAFNHKSIYTYPFHYIQASFMRDTRNPGQEDVFAQGNNFLSSFSRGYNSKWLYNDIFRMTYVREFGDHFMSIFGLKYWKQLPAGSLAYLYEPSPGVFDTARQITIGEVSTSLRWAPHEQFFQNKAGRANVTNKYPIMTLQYAKGIGGLFGGQDNYDAFHLNVYKRFYMGPLGYTDVTLDAGYLAGTLPFPLLVIPQANQSYFYSFFAYNLMNVEEFVNDHFAGVNFDHYFNGFFFNKIPLLKKLRLREVVAAKLLYGGVRDENNPALNPSQMKFPMTGGVLSTYTMGREPYLEASVGIFNIFSVIRLDLVKRFTYLNHPGISTLGLRFSSNFNF